MVDHRFTEVPGSTDSGSMGKLVRKVPGKHRWTAVAAYALTEEQAMAGMTENHPDPVLLDHELRMEVGISCWDCEMPYPMVHDQPCAAAAADEPEQEDHEVPEVSEPAEVNLAGEPPIGVPPTMDIPQADVTKAILVDSVGTAAVLAARREDVNDPTATPDFRIVLSLVGRQNRSTLMTHHMFMLEPEVVGLLMAQLLFYSQPLGPEVQEAFGRRMAELEFEHQETPAD